MQGATAGFADEGSGAVEWLLDKVAGEDSPYAVNRKLQEQGVTGGAVQDTDAYKTGRNEERVLNKKAEEANPVSYGAGEIGGGVLSALVPGAGGASVLKTAAASAAEGLGRSEADSAGGMATDALLSGVLGAGMGKGFQVAGKGISKVGSALSPAALRGLAERRAVKALEPILSQQELLNKRGAADKLGRELLDEGVVKFGSNVEGMSPRVEQLLKEKGKAIGNIRDKADERLLAAGVNEAGVDIEKLGRKADLLEALAGKGHQGEKEVAGHYRKNLEGMTTQPKRTITDLQENIMKMNDDIPFEKDLGKLTSEQKALKDLRGDYVDLMDKKIAELAPEDAGTYQKLKEQFGLFKQGKTILDKAAARQAKNADIGLRDLGLANIATNSRGALPGLKGAAVGVASKVGRERGNAALAVTADKLAKILESGGSLGKYTTPLKNALARGDKAFFAANAVLSQDPEFRAMLESLLEEVK